MLDIEEFKKKLDKKSRLMGIDPGRKRIGVAISDENKIIATPYTTLVKNKYSGLNGAMKTAFEYSESDSVVLYTAEDHQNFDVINQMFEKFKNGYDVVCASRLMLGGDYNKVKEPLIKKILVNIVSFTLRNFTNIGTVDPTNGFRLFSKEIIKKFPIESKKGFTFAIELLAKAYKNNYKITEVPSMSPLRKFGKSKFKNTSIIYYIPWFLKILFTKSKI